MTRYKKKSRITVQGRTEETNDMAAFERIAAISFAAGWLLAIVSLAPPAAQADIDPGVARAQQHADRFYEAGEYRKAYRKYIELAKIGDSFSQYRVSYMHYSGEGQDPDAVEAYAWAVLAAQNGNHDLVSYRDALWDALPASERDRAEEHAAGYLDRWGNLALAEEAARKARQRLRDCTGSRLGARCEDLYMAGMPLVVGGPPGGGGGGGETARSLAAASAGKGSEFNSIGAPAQDFEYFQELRQALRMLDQYIGEQRGNVTLGEFRVIEDEVDETVGDNN